MSVLGFSPCILISSFLTTLLLDRGVFANDSKQFPTASPWYPSGTSSSSSSAKTSSEEAEALKRILPHVTFDCRGKTGYFTDSKFSCEAFHHCQPDGSRNTFHCPPNQLFNQLSMVCEVRTDHNSRLCREGSINPARLRPSGARHTKAEARPSSSSNSSREHSPKKMMSLEELLGYMNGGNAGKQSEPTFISRFRTPNRAAADAKQSRNFTSDSAIQASDLGAGKGKVESLNAEFLDAELSAEGSDHTFSVSQVHPEQTTRLEKLSEDLSSEYDAIEGRKTRKPKRLDQTTEVSGSQKPSARSATDSPIPEDTTAATAGPKPAPQGGQGSPSLFSTDRAKARDFRKRKRYQGRKRKVQAEETTGEAETSPEPPATTSLPSARPEPDVNRRRKSQRTRTRESVLKTIQSSSKPEHVEPYTLPPLPTPTEDEAGVTTEMHKIELRTKERSRSKNPWYKSKAPPPEDENAKFGEKLSDLDLHHYQMDPKAAEGPASPDYYETKDIPNKSQEVYGEYSERDPLFSSRPLAEEERPKQKPKSSKRKPEEDNYKYDTHVEKHHSKEQHHVEKHHSSEQQHVFPPPRAEAREHHSTPPQIQLTQETGSERSKGTRGSHTKATTEDPFSVTHPYIEKYQKLKEMEAQKWKAEAEKPKPTKDKKVAVGSTFWLEEDDSKRPVSHSSSAHTPPEEYHQQEETPKHMLAHQHLSKIMNDFFAMSSSKIPQQVPEASTEDEEEEFVIPGYRIPEEDIYTGSESVSEDVEEIPPELLEVVNLLAGHMEDQKDQGKQQTSHEVIKINGPITDSQLEKIFLDDKFDEESEHEVSADGSYKKIVVVPRPEEKDEEMKEIAEMAEYTSLKLEPFLKQISGDKSVTVIPLKNEPTQKREPSVITAKKIPVRVIYRDDVKEKQMQTQNRSPEQTKPAVKLWHSHWPSSRIQYAPNGRSVVGRPVTQTFSSHTKPHIVLHPTSLFPPHPPPLQRKRLPFRVGYPFAMNSRSLNLNGRPIHSRQKRSIITRLRRQIRQNQHFLPFSSPLFPTYNPKFVPTFSPFRNLFRPTPLHASSSHLYPFTFPRYHLAKPTQNRQQLFRQNHPRPPPVRHVTQNGQTVIVEEVPIPIHVEVPAPNLIRPVTSASHPAKINSRYPGLRTPAPPAIQRPPLINRPQNIFPSTPGSYQPLGMPSNVRPPANYQPLGMPSNARPPGSYQPLGMPSNARPPSLNFQQPQPMSFAAGLPPRITSEGKLYALGVTNKPLEMSNPHPPRPYKANSPSIPPRPFNPYEIPPPHFPYFQGAFTTPLTNEPVPGRVMYSGYKPPKSTVGTKPPRPSSQSNKERKPSESQSNRSRTKPSQDYFEMPSKPMRESHVSYTEEVLLKGKARPKPSLEDHSRYAEHVPKQSLNQDKYEETKPKKRRPGRRKRPRPQSTTQGPSALNDISPTPPPPEQIPPPPSDYTSKPAHIEPYKSFAGHKESSSSQETSSNFPPAGYYGNDQLIHFLDSSSKTYQKPTTPKPRDYKGMGEHSSSGEPDDSFVSASMEDGDQPVFGTRLRSNPGESRNRHKVKQQKQSQSQNTEVRTRPPETMNRNTKHHSENVNPKRDFAQARPNEGGRTHVRNENQPPRRRRPPPPRPRTRSPPIMTTPQTQAHHFNYNPNLGNFYSVPNGLHTLVAPEKSPSPGFMGSTDMFGLPHPVIDQSIYSVRPKEAPVDFNPNFFSVPAHVAQQHKQAPLHQMNIKPMPESAREFFAAAIKESSKKPEESAKEENKPDEKAAPSKPEGDGENKNPPTVRKLRKPKRKNKYNPHSNEHRESAEASIAKPQEDPTTPRESAPARYREKPTSAATTTPEPRSTAALNLQNDIKESPMAFKQRPPLLPKSLPDISKSLLSGNVDYQKLNATISTSVSVSGGANQPSNASSEEKEGKRVFSSQNGGLAVVRKGPKRKRARQRVSTTTGVPYINSLSNSDAKYEIASSVLDIIKATTETERQASLYYDKDQHAAASKTSNIWIESKRTP